MNIFITGGAGFIGSHLADALTSLGHRVIVYDNQRTGKRENLSSIPHTYIQGDVRNRDFLETSMQNCDVVYHLAAFTSVVDSMENIDECIDINVQGTVNVLKSAKKNGLKRVLFSSSAAVYGDSPQVPKTEEMAPTPQSPYAITKLDGEYYGELFQRYFGVDTVCARFFNVFGERQDPQSSYAAAVPIFITRAIHDKSLTIYGDGNQTRDFIYVKDIVSALIYLMKTGNGVINIGYGKHITINDLVKTIKKIVNSKSSVHYEEKRPGEIEHSYASIHRLSSLGFQPAFSLEEGLRNTVNYYLQTASNERGQPG